MIAFPPRALGLIMAFGAGVLFSAVAYELVLEAYHAGTAASVALGLLLGSITFFGGGLLINWLGSGSGGAAVGGTAISLVLGALLDGIPESFILGLGLVSGASVSIAYLAALFLANLPESIAASAELQESGWTRRRLLALWCGIIAISALSAALGYLVFSNTSNRNGSIVLAFAGGAVLTMIADTMMPEAFEHGGKLTGVVTVLGFTLAIALAALE